MLGYDGGSIETLVMNAATVDSCIFFGLAALAALVSIPAVNTFNNVRRGSSAVAKLKEEKTTDQIETERRTL